MVIKKLNIKEHVPFTLNVEDRLVEPSINDAQKYDLLEWIGQQMVTALELVCVDYATWLGQWVPATPYTVGQKVTHGNQVWQVLVNNTGSAPVVGNANWKLLELASFWFANVKPYMAFNSCARYCLYAGKNFTQYGITQPFEPTSQPADSRAVAAIIKDLENKASSEFTYMDNALEAAKWKFDTIQYNKPGDAHCMTKKKSFGIKAI